MSEIYKRWICEVCDTPCYLQTVGPTFEPTGCPFEENELDWQPLEENVNSENFPLDKPADDVR